MSTVLALTVFLGRATDKVLFVCLLEHAQIFVFNKNFENVSL